MRFFTVVSLGFLSLATNAQDYLGNDPIWRVSSICAAPAPCIATDDYHYYTIGDSVIDNVTWTKVVRDGVVTYNWQASPPVGPGCAGMHPYGPDTHGIYLIRQEGRTMRIWADGTDQLLYDFDLTVGEYLPLTWNNWNTDITVIAMDEVLIGTEMRARYELGNSWAQYLIEGVGTSNGLFEPVSNFFDCGYQLDCFGLGDVAYFPSTGPGCLVVMSVEDQRRSDPITVAPNPANDAVTVHPVQVGEMITAYDAFSRMALQVRPESTNARLDVSSLPDGTYTLVVGEQRLRVVVIH